MRVDTKVTIFDGPLDWFHDQTRKHSPESFFLLVASADRNTIRVLGRDDVEEEPEYVGVAHVAAESNDFASLTDSSISNFAGLVRRHRPQYLYLHNPPTQVRTQLTRLIPDLEVRTHDYPSFTREHLRAFDDEFRSRLVGQARAREKLLAALYALSAPKRDRPFVAMLYGPSGVGKTETAMLLSELAGGDLLRAQFSMYNSDKFSSYVFGGSHSEPSLALDLLNRGSNVVLIDEFDKAHSSFYSAFYQLFDGGQFVDKNYSVDVGPALILCTSNFGSEKEIQDALGDALFSRFDAVIAYEELNAAQVGEVTRRIIAGAVDDLTPEEAKVIDKGDLERRLKPLTQHPGNVRRLRKLIDEFVSRTLVRAFLSDNLNPAEGKPRTRSEAKRSPQFPGDELAGSNLPDLGSPQ